MPLTVVVNPLHAAAYTSFLPVLPPPKVSVVLLKVQLALYAYALVDLFPTTRVATGTSLPLPQVALSYLAHKVLSFAVQISVLSLIVAVPQRTMTACLSPVIVEFSMFNVPGILNRIPASSLSVRDVVNSEFLMFISTSFPVFEFAAFVFTT